METKHFSTNPHLEKINAEEGSIDEISLITTGEILGHGMFLNEAGLDSFLQCIQGTQVKAYYKHSDENEALSSIGYFDNFQKKQKEDGEFQIVGDFSALNAWKENEPREYSAFFQLSQEAPTAFGISVEALIQSKYYNEEGEAIDLDENTPDDAEIFAFCEKVLAWSVVSTPATNPNGLFSIEMKELEEEKNNEIKELQDKIKDLETEMETLMELAKELRDANSDLSEENENLETEIDNLQDKVKSFEIGSDPVEHNFSEEISLSDQIKNEKDWSRKSKLILSNLNNLVIEKQGAR